MSHNKRTISRRAFLGRLMGGAVATWAAGYLSPETLWGQPSEQTSPGSPGLITRVTRPFDAETSVQEFSSYLTPNDRFFVRSHFGPPKPESLEDWHLHVEGNVERPLKFSLVDLTQFEEVMMTAVVQCSGNGRAFFTPKVPGAQWEKGAVGNATWTGVRLVDVLNRAGLGTAAQHVQMLGADRPILPTVPLFVRSIPIDKALHPDTILATRMNGDPLPLLHGAPLRLIVPGWAGDACVKWLTHLNVQEREAEGYYMKTAYRMPARPVNPGSKGKAIDTIPVEAMPVKSIIAGPDEGARVTLGNIPIQGVAWTGEGEVFRVEVSTDDGKMWHEAELIGEQRPYAWRLWRYAWRETRPGQYTVLARATDSRGQTQPMTTPWNPGGFLWNAVDRIRITVAG